MSDTPRTDAADSGPHLHIASHMERMRDLCRDLERELVEEREGGQAVYERAHMLERELAEARNERDAITRHAMKFEEAIARCLDGNRHDEDADALRCTLDTTGHELALRCIGCDSGAVLGEPIPHADDCATKQPHRQGGES